MKKIIALILAIVMVVALVSCGTKTVVTDNGQDAYYIPGKDQWRYTEDGGVSLDDPVNKEGTVIYVRDLFETGTIGSAESSGTLTYSLLQPELQGLEPDYVKWTLKDGVCILTGNPDEKPVSNLVTVDGASPLWNNPYIETIVVDKAVGGGIGSHTFTLGLPNLKTVVVLSRSKYNKAGEKSRLNTYGLPTFPQNQGINFIFTNDGRDDGNYRNPRPSTAVDTNRANDYTYYDNRADFVAVAGPMLAQAKMNSDAIAIIQTQAPDLYNAVIAAGGFNSTGTTVDPTPVTDTTKMSPWAVEEVNKAFELGIGKMDWTGKDLTQKITRAEFARLAVTTYTAITGNHPNYDVNLFTDVANTDTAVLQAARLGIINGYGNGKFGPNDLLTREQAATMLKRLADACGVTLPAGNNPFNDSISSWALDGVTACNAAKIMTGYGNGTFGAQDNYTVEQSLLTMYRTYDHIKG